MPVDKRLHPDDKTVSFFEMVHQVVQLIPSGRVTSYGAIARYLGAARSSRMVGWALNSSKTNIDRIPAHRVVNRKGMLTGNVHFKGIPMEQLLQQEGVSVTDLKIDNFNEVFWDPSEELGLD
ncbi:MAG: MGMT family protein [Bacteroidia bacterium]|nr:MGMT family protein [Bacteroidia bacterium]